MGCRLGCTTGQRSKAQSGGRSASTTATGRSAFTGQGLQPRGRHGTRRIPPPRHRHLPLREEGAAPTIVFDHCATPLGSNGGGDEEEEEEEKEEEQEGESRQSPYATDEQGIRRAWLSSPALGKHICFNGRHLHGAAGVLASAFDGTSTTSTTTGAAANAANEDEDDDDEEEEEESNEPPKKKQRGNEDDDESDGAEEGLRVTFLVNIWLNWKPLGAESLSDKIAAAMEATHSDVDGGSPTASSATASVSFGRPARAQCAPLVWSEGKHKGSTPRRLVRLFEQRGRPHKLSVPLPNEMPHDDEEEEEDEDEDEDEESEDGSNRGEQLPHGASAAITWPAEQSSAVAVAMIPGGDGDSDDNDSDDSDDSSSDDEGGTKLSFRTSTKPNADDDDDDGDKDDREEFELVD